MTDIHETLPSAINPTNIVQIVKTILTNLSNKTLKRRVANPAALLEAQARREAARAATNRILL